MIDKFGNVITRGPKEGGNCNICGVYGKLTEDHVPPKGSTKVTQVKMLSIHKVLDIYPEDAKGRYSQNGVKFRTLCASCNNHILGKKLDPYLNDKKKKIIGYVTTNIVIPEIINIKAKPNLITRAVLGHMLAIGINQKVTSDLEQGIANYVLGVDSSIPDGIEMYYWVYPYRKQILIRNSAIGRLGEVKEHGVINFWCIKYFPLAFMVTLETRYKYKLDSLNPFLSNT